MPLVKSAYQKIVFLFLKQTYVVGAQKNRLNEMVVLLIQNISSLQCYSVLSDILVKIELCIPLERGSDVLSTGEGFICLSPTS